MGEEDHSTCRDPLPQSNPKISNSPIVYISPSVYIPLPRNPHPQSTPKISQDHGTHSQSPSFETKEQKDIQLKEEEVERRRNLHHGTPLRLCTLPSCDESLLLEILAHCNYEVLLLWLSRLQLWWGTTGRPWSFPIFGSSPANQRTIYPCFETGISFSDQLLRRNQSSGPNQHWIFTGFEILISPFD